jgi:hypothetical protein
VSIFSQFFEQFSRRTSDTGARHPVRKHSPHGEREKAHEDVRLRTVFLLMEDRSYAEIAFGCTKSILHLRELDVGLPQFLWISFRLITAAPTAEDGLSHKMETKS